MENTLDCRVSILITRVVGLHTMLVLGNVSASYCDSYTRDEHYNQYSSMAYVGGTMDYGMFRMCRIFGGSTWYFVGACDLYKLDKPSKVVTWFVGGSFIQSDVQIGCFCINDNENIQVDYGVGACIVIDFGVRRDLLR